MTSPSASLSKELLQNHCRTIIQHMAEGILVPVLGPGLSASHPSRSETIAKDAEKLSEGIAETVDYPWPDRKNLLRVSWYGKNHDRSSFLAHLHDVFSAKTSTKTHEFFAALPGRLDAKGYPNRRQLIITTNYDRKLENALDLAGELYALVTYVANSAEESEEGKFRYRSYDGKSEIVDNPSSYILPIEENVLEYTIILKIQGTVDSLNWKEGSFAVSDEDYIDYLARSNTPAHNIPVFLMQKMQQSHFLFLGLGIGEWNQRVILRSLMQPRKKFDPGSWAIMHKTEGWDSEYWDHYGVELLELPLDDYIEALDKAFNDLSL